MEFLKSIGFKGQMAAMVIGAVIIVAGGYKGWPNLEKDKKTIVKLQKQLDELNVEIEKGRNLEKKLPELEREIQNLEAQLAELRQIMPPVRDDSKLIKKFAELGARSRVSISRIDPGRLQKKEFYDEYPLTLDVEANYHDMGLFFARLAQLPRIFNVDTVQMRQQLTEANSITANFQAVTFIYREDETPPQEVAKSKRRKRS